MLILRRQEVLPGLLEKVAKYVLPFIDPHYQKGAVGEYRHKQRIDENNEKFPSRK